VVVAAGVEAVGASRFFCRFPSAVVGAEGGAEEASGVEDSVGAGSAGSVAGADSAVVAAARAGEVNSWLR